MKTNTNADCVGQNRNGTVAVLFAITLPILLLISAIAINLAQMQLTRTELKIATDAAARGGGRAWSEFHNLETAKDFARQGAALNTVSGSPLLLSTAESDGQIIFGSSDQAGAAGRFVFTPMTESEVTDGALPTGVQVNASQSSSLFFQIGSNTAFNPAATSVASQLDRDIGLVFDRSGSMIYFSGQDTDPGEGEDFLYNTITSLYNDPANGITEAEYDAAGAGYDGDPHLAAIPLSNREYSPNILSLLTGDLKVYAETINSDYRPGTAGPAYSRWHMLTQGNAAFFEVLNQSTRENIVSVSSFATNGRLDVPLTTDMVLCEAAIDDMLPIGSTSIGDGMLESYAQLKASTVGRPSAVKTLVVFTDGVSNTGTDPDDAANQIIADNPQVVIHTVTFGVGADRSSMQAISDLSNGKHYHAENGSQLISIFREIANSHKTLITE